jgi:predicted DsbA family dithiol-disulfide isomerase
MVLNNIIEVFLFVNPLGPECYETEKLILGFSKERDEKVRLRFIPLVNFHTIGHQINVQNIEGATLEMRNKLYNDSYHASLAFQAASMQGKKKGRQFLLALQKAVVELKKEFNKQTVLTVAEEVNLDMEMFEEDLTSDLAKNAFTKDQKLAQEMSVSQAPSCVVFQDMDKEIGYRIDSSLTEQLLHGLCDTKEKDNPKFEELRTKFTLQTV